MRRLPPSFAVNKAARNHGVDLLRIIAMIMIVGLHFLRQGGVLESVSTGTAQYFTAWCAEAFFMCAVNIYALISGFVGINARRTKYSRLASLWLLVEFYCIISAALKYGFYPELFTPQRLAESLMPVVTDKYWYFTAYFIMFFFTPVFNSGVRAMSRAQMKLTLAALFLLGSAAPTFFKTDIFYSHGGYSLIWISALYIAGGILKRLELHKKAKPLPCLAGAAALCAFGFAMKAAFDGGHTSGYFQNQAFMIYTSANITAAAALALLGFAGLSIRRSAAVKAIKAISPLTFGVYIIHTSEFAWENLLKNAFSGFAELPAVQFAAASAGTVLAIFAVCCAIEAARSALFKLLRVDELLARAESAIRGKIKKNEKQNTPCGD